MSSLLQSLSVYIAAAIAPLNNSADLVFAGDAMQHAAQIEAAHTPDGQYDYLECFAAVDSFIKAADYAVVNLETPLGGKPYSGYPCFCAPDQYAMALRDAGFDLFLTANNHTLDRRDRGLKRTIAVLDSLHVDHIGTYCNDSARAATLPLVKDINGFKIGFLNYTYGTNGITPGKEIKVDYIDTLLISRDIKVTRDAGAELLVVAMHWGDEYKLLPNNFQKRLAQYLVNKGVDIVLGGHPHVIQPIEFHINPSDTLDRQLIVYSLGNFISNMKTRDTRGGAMLKVTLKRAINNRPYIAAARYKTIFTLPPQRPRHNYRLVNDTDSIDNPYMRNNREQFLRSARGIFNTHNINCPDIMSN